MKIHAIHDAGGNITRIIVCPPNAPPAGTAVGPGYFSTEVEAPDIMINAAAPESYQNLVQVLKNFQVELKTESKLVRKNYG